MKKILTLNLLSLLLLVYSQTLKADEIWNVDFSKSINKGYWGVNSDMLDVSDWLLDVSACNFENDNDYVKVVATSGGRLEAVDCNGVAIWKSRDIDISKFSDCNISVDVAETGSSGNSEKFVRLFYQLDGGAEYPFETNAENVGNWDKVQASQGGLNGNTLVVIAKISNPLSSNKVYFDNVLVNGVSKPVKKNNLSQVLPSKSPDEPSVIESTVTTKDDAVRVFKFIIDETIDANDKLPTKIKRMVFYNQNPTVGISWEKNLGGVLLFDDETEISPSKLIISNDSICMDFLEGVLEIPDGGKKELSLKCYLNSSETVDDKGRFQMYIKENSNGFECYESGSGMDREYGGAFSSSIHTVDVRAAELSFSELLTPVFRGKDFSLEVKATDLLGNIDIDANHTVNIELITGDIDKWQITNRSTYLNNGVAKFYGLQYHGIHRIAFKASAISLSDSPFLTIDVLNARATEVLNVDWDLDQARISSLLTDSLNAIDVFKFKIRDGGDDNLPTVIKQIKLVAGEHNQLDWKKSVGGFKLKREDTPIGMNYLWDKNRLTIELNSLTVESEQEASFTLSLYLKEGKTIDASQFQIRIDNAHEGWLIDSSGSDFREIFSDNLVGPLFTCDVVSTKMKFLSLPDHVPFDQIFCVEISLLDEMGNVDFNSDREIKLSLASGNGELKSSSSFTKSATNGVFKWDDLSYSAADNFTLLAESKELNSVLSDNISAVDQTSKILPGEKISILDLPATTITRENAVSVLNFSVEDVGNYDDLSTKITTARFNKCDVINGFSWEKHIAGAVIKKGEEFVAHTTNINDSYIQFYSSGGLMEIENGSTEEYSLSVYFRSGQVPDNTKLQVYIPKVDHGWKSKESGSGIEPGLTDKIISEIHRINVVADRVLFGEHPFVIKDASDPFSLDLLAVDSCSNVDQDFNGSVRVKSITSDGSLYSNDLVGIVNGEYIFEEITYEGSNDFKMVVEYENHSDTTIVYLGKDLLAVNEDFESEELSGWFNTADWTISSYNKLEGSYSLKHNLSQCEGGSYITRPLNNWRPDCGAIQWQFVLKNGDWDPNGHNNFQFHLVSNNDNPNKASLTYSIGVNQNDSDDLITLSKLENGVQETLLKSNFNWDENEQVAISVSYTSDGNWSLAINRLGELKNWTRIGEVNGKIVGKSDSWFSCLQFNYGTASRAGELWFDNLKINAVATPPKLMKVEVENENLIVLEFSKSLDFEKCLLKSGFELLRMDQKIEIIELEKGESGNSINLILKDTIESGTYSLKVENIIDLDSKVLKTDVQEFNYLAPARQFDIVFNELLIDESPSIGLPEYEFIELYNRSEHSICIENWILKVGEKETVLKNDTIKSNSFLILCSNAARDSLVSFGEVLGVTSFPTLTNSGNAIELASQTGVIIDKLTYSDKWYQSDLKNKGGWTLERIDPNNISWQESNWTSSMDQSGGTPGRENSVRESNLDKTHPELVDWILLSDTTIKLCFNEPMGSEEAMKPENYGLSNLQQNPDTINYVSDREIVLIFRKAFVVNQEYILLLSDRLVDLAGNKLSNPELKFVMAVKAERGDVVINEILFNPYPGGSDYVEIFNKSDNYIDLNQLLIANLDENYQINEAYILGEMQKFIPPQQYLLVSEDTAYVAKQYPANNKAVFLQLKNLPSYLDESGRVVLLRLDNDMLDDFAYSAQMHSDLLSDVEGVALERVNPNSETNRASNWQSAAQTIGFGTPGLQNSVFSLESFTESEVSLSSKRFTPNNDGVDDRLLINFKLKEAGYWANVRIFNSMGKQIRKLASNISIAQEDQLYWDGLGSNKERLPIGIYVVYIELFNEAGDVKNLKKTCVLGGKFN